MGKLTEEISLRDKIHVFEDRKKAGLRLAEKLIKYKGSGGIVLGIPSGGAPVAWEVAKKLGLQMDLLVVRKIQIPDNPEAGFGAVAPDGNVVLNEQLLAQLGLKEAEIKEQIKITNDVIKKREEIFRQGKPFPDIKGRIAILVDDGLASGYTMLAAVGFIKRKMPGKIIVAVPTASERTVVFILPQIDELVCLNVRRGATFAVADAYRNWYDLTDKEVISILH